MAFVDELLYSWLSDLGEGRCCSCTLGVTMKRSKTVTSNMEKNSGFEWLSDCRWVFEVGEESLDGEEGSERRITQR